VILNSSGFASAGGGIALKRATPEWTFGTPETPAPACGMVGGICNCLREV